MQGAIQMAKNNKFWKTFVAGSEDKRHAAITGEDPLEEGLKDLTWFENSKRAVRRKITKTYETFGEEIGNSVSAGVPALYLLIQVLRSIYLLDNAVLHNNDSGTKGHSLGLVMCNVDDGGAQSL